MEQDKSFNRIYAETRDELLRYLMIRTSAAPEAEDLFQEVYRRLYLRLTRGVLPIREPKRYLFSIAKKVLSRYYRSAAARRANEQPIPDDMDMIAEDEPIDEQIFRAEQKQAVWRLLQEEPELNRRIFLLFYGYDLKQAEIGKALGISEQAVRQRLYRTRLKIRLLLESEQR